MSSLFLYFVVFKRTVQPFFVVVVTNLKKNSLNLLPLNKLVETKHQYRREHVTKGECPRYTVAMFTHAPVLTEPVRVAQHDAAESALHYCPGNKINIE